MSETTKVAEKNSAWKRTQSLAAIAGRAVYFLVSVIIFPLGLARLFVYFDGKKRPNGFADKAFYRPVWYIWNNALKSLVKVLWILFSILFFPVGLYYIGSWIVTGTSRKFWNDFGSYIGTWSRAEGTWNWMRFIYVKDMFHFHILTWPIMGLAIWTWLYGESQSIGIWFIALHILAARTYFKDLPWQKFIKAYVPTILLILLADVGVRFGAQHLWQPVENFLQGRYIGIPDYWVFHTFPESINITWGERGFIVPAWNFVNFGEIRFSTWGLFIYSLVWGYYVMQVFVDAVWNRRAELDSRTLTELRWGETERTYQVYMRNSTMEFPDIFEAIFSGTGNLIIETNRGQIRYDNVVGLIWLRIAYHGLRNSKTIIEQKIAEKQAHGEDASELVKDFDEEMQQVGHKEQATSHQHEHDHSHQGEDHHEVEHANGNDYLENETST